MPLPRDQSGHSLDRVVIISDDAVESGGAAMIALASMRLFRARGLPVTALIAEDGEDPTLRDLTVDVVHLGGSHILQGSRLRASLRGLYDNSIRKHLDAWIDAHDTERTIYHLHNWHKALSPSAFAALRRVEDRLVLTAHDFFLACPNGGYYNYRRDQVCDLTPMSRACLSTACDKRHIAHKAWRSVRHSVRDHMLDLRKSSATVVAVHDGMVPLLERAGIARTAIDVVRNPIVPWHETPISAERNRLVLYVGRLEHDKGIDLLLEAARRANAPLRVVGDGPLRETLQARYPEAEFMGRLDRAGLSRASIDARLVIVPTRVRETFGLVALEGLISGIPLITSSSALIANEVMRLGMAVAVPPGNIEALAEALSSLQHDDSTVACMSRAARAGARALAPTPAEWCDTLLELYRRKIAAH
ncbi:MAG: glycosyltransferase family 4 protein [Rhodospirillales bacterium]|nr:glycosyltransferase family 4 protein [Rhodospirillales bacterium]